MANIWFLNSLTAREDLSRLPTLRRSMLLKIRGVGKSYAAKIERWQKSATISPEVEWVGAMIIADAARSLALVRVPVLCRKRMARAGIPLKTFVRGGEPGEIFVTIVKEGSRHAGRPQFPGSGRAPRGPTVVGEICAIAQCLSRGVRWSS